MKTRFFDEQKLEGNFIDLPYGSYTFAQLSALISQIKSINIPPRAKVTLYAQDNFRSNRHVIANTGNKNLKVTGFEREFPFAVRSLMIECACKLDRNPEVELRIIKDDFKRNNQIVAYTFYQVIPEPLDDPLAAPSPFNPTILIIPDFGTDKRIYECLQDIFAQSRFSSIVLDLRGTGQSYSSTSVKYADIIQDYRFIAQQLNQYVKKPILIGHGIGGAIAQLWAITYKFELRNLILIDSAPYAIYSQYHLINTQIQQWINNIITTEQFATIVANNTYNTISEDCEVDKLKLDLSSSIINSDSATLKRLFTQNPDNVALAMSPKTILTPTLLMHGLQDAVTSITGTDNLFALIKGAKQRRINTSHSPHLTTQSRAVEAILYFLSPEGNLYI